MTGWKEKDRDPSNPKKESVGNRFGFQAQKIAIKCL
jgi:hypothetical protein